MRYLRPTQIVSRAYYRLADSLGDPDRWSRRSRGVEIGECRWRPRTWFLPPEQQRNSAVAIAGGRFHFQNDGRSLGMPVDWKATDAPLLWQYNLHYFDYLWSLDFDAGQSLVADWIERYPLGRGQTGWAPYPTSLRLLNWCAFFFGRHLERLQTDTEFQRRLQTSIGLQTAWLSRRLEYHLLGNHLLENAVALAIVGTCFDGPDSYRCFGAGLRLLRRELREQILPDGMHFELSPMYHLRVLYLLLTLMNVVPDGVHDWLGQYVSRMLDALRCTTHPDGNIALLNDSALGVYSPPANLAEYAQRLGVFSRPHTSCADECFALPDAGYYGARTIQGHYLICDAGKIGPNYIPGHAHGDIFSFELSLFGERIVVDSGVYDYVGGPMRDYCRSTAAHNTVEVAGQDQCEFWGTFRVARRGRPRGVQFEKTERGFRLSGQHDGYQHLPGRPIHRREFEWAHDGALRVCDMVESHKAVPLVSRIHLHPACRVVSCRGSSLILGRGANRCLVNVLDGGLRVNNHWYCSQFGVREESLILELIPSAQDKPVGFRLTPCS